MEDFNLEHFDLNTFTYEIFDNNNPYLFLDSYKPYWTRHQQTFLRLFKLKSTLRLGVTFKGHSSVSFAKAAYNYNNILKLKFLSYYINSFICNGYGKLEKSTFKENKYTIPIKTLYNLNSIYFNENNFDLWTNQFFIMSMYKTNTFKFLKVDSINYNKNFFILNNNNISLNHILKNIYFLKLN